MNISPVTYVGVVAVSFLITILLIDAFKKRRKRRCKSYEVYQYLTSESSLKEEANIKGLKYGLEPREVRLLMSSENIERSMFSEERTVAKSVSTLL